MELRRTIASLSGFAAAAEAEERLPTIPPAQYTAEQKQAAADFEAARKVPVFGPFEPLMHSPKVMLLAGAMGDYLRYKSAIGNTLSELVILITAREWTQDYEWYLHEPIALKAGIRRELADAIAEDGRPAAMSADEEIVYDFRYRTAQEQGDFRCDVRASQVALRHKGCRRPDRNCRLLYLPCDAAQCRAVSNSKGWHEATEKASLDVRVLVF